MQVLRIEGLRQGKDTQALRFFFGRYCGRFTEKMNALCGLCERLIAKSATTSRAGSLRMAPGRGRSHLCWGSLIFKKNFLISVLSDLLVLMTT